MLTAFLESQGTRYYSQMLHMALWGQKNAFLARGTKAVPSSGGFNSVALRAEARVSAIFRKAGIGALSKEKR